MKSYSRAKYFKGYVTFIHEGKFRIFFPHKFLLENGAIVKIKATNYFRLQPIQEIIGGSIYFPIVSPIAAIKILEGEIPENSIVKMTYSDFLAHKNMYK